MIFMTFYIYAIGICISIVYAMIGPFLVLLKNAFTIDAIGHSIIFGIATGFLLTQNLSSYYMIFFALLSAFLMNSINEIIQKNSIIEVDASLGITFSTLFTIGILLISLYEKNIHLDLDMILLGNIEYSIYECITIYGFFVPAILVILLFFIGTIGLFIYYYYDSMNIFMFDSQFAMMKGIPYSVISFIFITIMTILIVVTFHAMGALLLLGMAVSPFGFSWGRVNSLKDFLFRGILYSVLSTVFGICISLFYDISIAATIVFCVSSFSLLSLWYRLLCK